MERNNTTGNFTCTITISQQIHHVRYVMPIVLCLIALATNLLVICLIAFKKQLHKTMNCYIVNMSVSDIITAITISFLHHKHNDIATATAAMCSFKGYWSRVAPLVSLFTMVIISIDRYQAVANPLLSTMSSKTRVVLSIAITWLIPSLFHLYLAMDITFIEATRTCQFIPTTTAGRVYKIFINSLPVPVFIYAVVINFKIIKILRSSMKYRAGQVSYVQWVARGKRLKRIKSAVLMVSCSLGLFLFLCFPKHLTYSLQSVKTVQPELKVKKCIDWAILTNVLHNLLVANSALGPLLYFIFIKDFREALKAISFKNAQVTSALKNDGLFYMNNAFDNSEIAREENDLQNSFKDGLQ